jgi:hypothetical protein
LVARITSSKSFLYCKYDDDDESALPMMDWVGICCSI